MLRTFDGSLAPRAVVCVALTVACLLVMSATAWADTPPSVADTTQSPPAAVGDTITLTQGTYTDEDPGGTGTITDTWFDCNNAAPATVLLDCVELQNGGLTYQVQGSDQTTFSHNYIVVFESDSALLTGPAPTDPGVQVAAPPVGPSPPTDQAAPSIAGSPTIGTQLTAVTGIWSGGSPTGYTWERCASDGSNCVSVASGGSYPLTQADDGAQIVLAQAASNGGSSSATAYSSLFGPITPADSPPDPPSTSGSPTISGHTQLGALLSAKPVKMSNNPSYSYQWRRCANASCSDIPGATGTGYTPTPADIGDVLAFQETGTNAGGSGGAQSAKSAIVTSPTKTSFQVSPSNVVAGQTATLIATVSSETNLAPPAGTVTFERSGSPISGCASVTTNPSGASATVTCTTTFPGSSSKLSAEFAPKPGALVTGSNSTTVGFNVGRAATTATISVPNRATLGRPVTLTANITPQPGTGGRPPSGNVVFLDAGKPIAHCDVALSQNRARCRATFARLGHQSISATYLGDKNYAGSSTHLHPLTVSAAKPSGYVTSLMAWTFAFEPTYTRVTKLQVTGLQPGVMISLGCTGRGCPIHRYADRIRRSACHGHHHACPSVNLAKRLGGRHLAVGNKLTVRLTHRGWVGKYYRFAIRHGRQPKIRTACLAVSAAKPGGACTPR